MNTNLIPIREQLERIEKKLDGKLKDKFLTLLQVFELVSLSPSTIYRAIRKGELRCSKNTGKLLFLESNVMRWING